MKASDISLDTITPTGTANAELVEILDSVLDRIHRGDPVDIEQLRVEHPKYGDQLAEYLSSFLFLERAYPEVSEFCGRRDGPDRSGQRIGDYEIVREIGRGGMGIVYEAKQISLGRTVAIKVLPFAALLDDQQIARFVVESQAAAKLQHPHIVPVFAVGEERGMHFYSMQYVDGESLQDAIQGLRERESSGPARSTNTLRVPSTGHRDFAKTAARLGIEAAEALQHAHDGGVIHRDIKPSNLLIDHSGKLWVTDFGLARCQTDSEITMTGAVVGTVHYMSPEQATGRTRLVDHRTDIYSLGVTLYELLTLQKAYAAEDRLDFLRRIESHEPTSPRRLNRSIPIDLETIILKAMSKRRGHRYQSAAGLASDLRRFLDGKPIEARRPTLIDHFAKWASRHRRAAAAALVLFVLCVAGGAVSLALLAREQAKTRAAFESVQHHLEQSQQHFRQARAVVDRLGLLSADRLADTPGTEALRRELLADTLQYYQDFVSQSGDDPTLQVDIAVTHFKTAEIHEQMGDLIAALDSYQHARDILERVLKLRFPHPQAEEGANEPPRGQFFEFQNTFLEKLRSGQTNNGDPLNHLIACYNNLGMLQTKLGDAPAANTAFRRAHALHAASPSTHADRDTRRKLALIHSNQGMLYQQTGEFHDAKQSFSMAADIQRALLVDEPANANVQHDLAMTYNNLSFLHAHRSLEDALKYGSQSVSLLRQLLSDGESSPRQVAADLGLALNNQGALLGRKKMVGQARDSYREALAIFKDLTQTLPHLRYRRELAVTCNNLGRTLLQLGETREAEAMLQQAVETLRNLSEQSPDNVRLRGSLGGALNNWGAMLEQRGEFASAEQAYIEAASHLRGPAEKSDIRELRAFLQASSSNLRRVRARIRDARIRNDSL